MQPSDAICEVCGLTCDWQYTGGVYAIRKPGILCAQCISDGRTGEAVGSLDFEFHDSRLEGVDEGPAEELMKRTPAVACFNPFEWPVLDGMPMAFIGVGDEAELIAIPEVRAAIGAAFEEIGWDPDGESPYALVFREVAGQRWRAVVDLD